MKRRERTGQVTGSFCHRRVLSFHYTKFISINYDEQLAKVT